MLVTPSGSSGSAGGGCAGGPAETGDSDVCQDCGFRGEPSHVQGLLVCSSCGSVRSFATQLKDLSFKPGSQLPQLGSAALLRVGSRRGFYGPVPSKEGRRELELEKQQLRCRAAIARFATSVHLQDAVSETALTMLTRHCRRVGFTPKKGLRLKRLVCASVYISSSRLSLGLTMQEVWARSGLHCADLKRTIWRMCRAGGIRLPRANADALLQRLCSQMQVNQQRGAICTVALRLLAIAEQGWVATGRFWSSVVTACLVLAAKAYNLDIDVDALAKLICVQASLIVKRKAEIRHILVAVLKVLPWGDMVCVGNVHCYMLFAVEHFDVLAPLVPELRRRQLEADAAAPAFERQERHVDVRESSTA
eukprot:gnl/TRDRNA2_/TRDRNA2_80763_c0_seq2.p1 gnl/TRDRNA2_/TRDRNA2_80763_c0~~gnl/TRDRNA2_/TRDRNA2_80763_c0_seq2.p1  ORF type:complete len:364 (+),score=42.62 gnl/TRDRNA2_/TRDRNA2_80763_c0_seq2:28-1119(+)